jgi:hypothetical protein
MEQHGQKVPSSPNLPVATGLYNVFALPHFPLHTALSALVPVAAQQKPAIAGNFAAEHPSSDGCRTQSADFSPSFPPPCPSTREPPPMKTPSQPCGLLAARRSSCPLFGRSAQAQDRSKLKAVGTACLPNRPDPEEQGAAVLRATSPNAPGCRSTSTTSRSTPSASRTPEQLRVMKAGLSTSCRCACPQNSRDEPTILGLDLVGWHAPDYATWPQGREGLLRDRWTSGAAAVRAVKLCACGRFGPQILFCKKPNRQARRHQGHEGARVRPRTSRSSSSWSGGPRRCRCRSRTRHQSLSLGVVDCAITGPSSANSSGWPMVTTHQLAERLPRWRYTATA